MEKNNTFIVAELSANHANNMDVVKRSIKTAKEIGCDAVKIQTLFPEGITIDCDNEYFQINTETLWDGTTLYDLYSKAYLPWEWHQEIFDYAEKTGIILFSSPFDKSAVDLLETCGNPIYKVASFEITDIPLIRYIAQKGKPIIISTGIATEEEILDAVNVCREEGNEQITLLKCTSEYPARLEDVNLMTMVDMKEKFGIEAGLSDHTLGIATSVAAATLGAKVIEKHFILNRDMESLDAAFSMTPDEFADMVRMIRDIEKAKGSVTYELNERALRSRKYARSLFVVEDVRAGDCINEKNVKSIRPSNGMLPKYYGSVAGKTFKYDVKRGTPLKDDMVNQ